MVFRFDLFEVDSKNGRLLKLGVPLLLREQAFQVLLALVERPGETVTRSELRSRLWSDATNVDFDTGLNTAVSRLRDVLQDDAATPRFIETIPKRGYRFKAPLIGKPSVAVMPLRNRASDAETEYLADGLTEDLIGAMSRIEGINVVAASVVRRFRAANYDAKQAATEFGVPFVVEGSFLRSDERIQIQLHLVNGADGFNIRSEHFDEKWSEISSIAERAAAVLAVALKREIPAHPAHTQAANSAAYDAYLRGQYLVARYPVSKALQYFAEAMRLDPNFALPYHGAAVAHILRCLRGESPAKDELTAADELLERGLRMAPELSQLRNTLGMLRMFQCKWDEAELAYVRALSLEPGNGYAHMMYALHNSFLGRHDQGLHHAREAMTLQPLDEMTNFRLVQCFYYARQYDSAIQAARTGMSLYPNFPNNYRYISFALMEVGAEEEAFAAASKTLQMSLGAPFFEGGFGYVAGRTGHSEQARQALGRLLGRRESGYCPAYPISLVYCGMQDSDGALQWLEAAQEEGEPYVASALVFPGYDFMRSQPRFQGLLKRSGH